MYVSGRCISEPVIRWLRGVLVIYTLHSALICMAAMVLMLLAWQPANKAYKTKTGAYEA